MKIKVIGKDKPVFHQAIEFLKQYDPDLIFYTGKNGDAFPADQDSWECDYLISMLSHWIVPKSVLQKARKAAVNFHPGPPEYPGTGCTNFALYEEASEYGVTFHHMSEGVDTGDIIAVKRFAIEKKDSVLSLTERCYENMLLVLKEILPKFFEGKDCISSNETWSRKAFLRKELDALCKIELDMNPEEIQRRIRATVYPGMPGPYIQFRNYRFELKA